MEGTKSKKRAAEVQKSKSPKKPKIAKEVKKGRKKSKGDGPQVKRASSAYIHFTTDFRKTLKEKCEKSGDPLPKANEVAKMAGEQWKKLTAEEKKLYHLKAQADKERYLKESGKLAKKELDKPKRALTAYFIFLAEFREQMIGKSTDGDQKIPALAGKKWRSMSNKDKEKYKKLEAEAKKKHEAAMEEWKKKNAGKEAAQPSKPKTQSKKAPPKKEVPKPSESEEEDDDDDEEEEEEEEDADDVDDDEQIMEINTEAIGTLSNLLRERGLELPTNLRDLLVNTRSISGKTHNKELRWFIYREMFTFLAHQNGIGDWSLIYPPEIVDTIRQLYPGDVKNYTPNSKKRKSFYEVTLEELIEAYKEADLRDGSQQPQDGPSSPLYKKRKKE